VFKFLPKKDIRLIAKDALIAIKKSNMILEINPVGLRKPINESYPSKQLLEMAYEMGIDITFGSDAHNLEQIGFKYDEITTLSKEIGFSKCVTFDSRDRKHIEF
ncbi:MAG: PHP-associated domain-containing protein, partial [Arcobacter sp.]